MSAADDLAASLVTVNDGRAALGVTASWIAKGYARAKDLPTGANSNPIAPTIGGRTVLDWVTNAPNEQQAATDLLGQLNTYATQVYAELDAQTGSDPIGDLGRQKVLLAFQQAERAFTLIDQQARTSLFDDWIAAVQAVIVGVARGAEYIVKAAAQLAATALSPLQSTILSVVALLVAGGVVYLLARRAI